MREYSPKRRTAVVFTGTGVSGAYHAGALKAFEESGLKIDLVVGSGVGCVAAAFAAVAGGPKLYGAGGLWETLTAARPYRLRPEIRALQMLFGFAFGVFVLPIVVALLVAFLFPAALLVDWVSPGALSRLTPFWPALADLRSLYVVALAAPLFLLFVVGGLYALRLFLKERRRLAERLESVVDTRAARSWFRGRLWEAVRGADATSQPPREATLGERFVSLAVENGGQPGFRELILRAADLDAGRTQTMILISEAARTEFLAGRGARRAADSVPGVLDLQSPGCAALLFPMAFTGLLPPFVTAPERLPFPRSAAQPGRTHRLTESTLLSGCGIADAVEAGAEQVIVVSGAAENPSTPLRRRGPRALAEATLETLERHGFERELAEIERASRMIETLGHRTEGGGRAWQDPATGRVYRDVSVYVVRPQARALRPFDHVGALDPVTEVVETPEDLIERGYQDAFQLFIEPVVGGAPAPRRYVEDVEEGAPAEL